MTALEWQAASTVVAAQRLAHFVQTTQEDKLTWTPSSELGHSGRNAMEQVGECIRLNHNFASVLRGQGPLATEVDLSDPVRACEDLVASARVLAEVIGSQEESVLQQSFETGFGSFPGTAIVSIPAWNMIYHCGQVNYIQLLYGDTEFRIPPA